MMRRTSQLRAGAGVSGMAVYAPPCRVALKDWCEWTNNSWDKVSSVVGDSFRIPNTNENTYTMAATAALRLILNNNIDPTKIGFLGLGTESSTDNSAGSIIVRGMLDKALRELGMPRISRSCEVPEFKHACLGGVYALKSAVRYASTDAAPDQVAIVVASDIAEYALGSSGEQTQGAGSVAMLVEKSARLFEVDTASAGSASAYRGPDFRKPFKRHFIKEYGSNTDHGKIPDFPVFSGPYSTMVYLDEVTVAVENMMQRLNRNPGEYYNNISALFFHRPYNMMPIQAMSFLYARGLARATSQENVQYFKDLCAKGKTDPQTVVDELKLEPDYFDMIEKNELKDVYVATNKVAKALRSDKSFSELLAKKMSLGSPAMANFGNLYTASLPCWIAAGLEEAYTKNIDITSHPMVMVGYGSGDASESIPMVPVPNWQEQAAKINVSKALENPINVTKEQYEGLHRGEIKVDLAQDRRHQEFVIAHVGNRNEAAFQDIGIEYYKYVQ